MSLWNKKKTYQIPNTLVHSVGTITATFDDTVYNVAVSGLTAHATYFLYVRKNAGVPTMFAVTTVPSTYRASFADALLVGAFMASESGGWGSFINIEGTPRTQTNMTWTPSQTGFGSLGTPNFNFLRHGKRLICDFRFTTGTVVGSAASFGLPTNLEVDPTIYPQTSYYLGNVQNNSNVGTTSMNIFRLTDPARIFFTPTNQGGVSILGNTSPLASGQIEQGSFDIAISSWNETPLKDL